ncbi:MAG TPA: 2-dehydropantoate 2-reductase [Gemmatimonadales bacterium]|nr:2-dehydropantoate 2-reductase [Gemmatimonadales bacterium]
MRIAVFGSGAVGGYFGGRLAEAGEELVFIARGPHLAALRADGLRITSTKGDVLIAPAQATDDPSSVGPVDLILVGVKAWQVPEAAKAIVPLVGTRTAVLPLQNGIEAPDQLAAILGPGPVLGGYCRLLAHIAGPGHIHHTGGEPFIGHGELDGVVSERVREVQRAFARAPGLGAEIAADIRIAMWNKFLFIASLSAVGAYTELPIGELRTRPETRRLLTEALAEAVEVARADGIRLPDDTLLATLAFIDSLPHDGTTSMQRDIASGRPSELDAQSGAVVRLGDRAGVAVPTHRHIYDALLPKERAARAAQRAS